MAPKTGEGDGAARSSAASSAPPPDFGLLFDIMLACGVLNAVDLSAIGCCSRDLRRSVEEAWTGIRKGNKSFFLQSAVRPVDDADANRVTHKVWTSVKEAGPCVSCAKTTRFRHPIEGSLLCASCGRKAETAKCLSPLFRFRFFSQSSAWMDYGVSKTVDLRLFLRWTKRKMVWCDKEKKLAWSHKYAPAMAETDKAVLPQASDAVVHRPPANLYAAPQAVFLRQDVLCLLLERFGGPRLLSERLRNQDLGFPDPANPDDDA